MAIIFERIGDRLPVQPPKQTLPPAGTAKPEQRPQHINHGPAEPFVFDVNDPFIYNDQELMFLAEGGCIFCGELDAGDPENPMHVSIEYNTLFHMDCLEEELEDEDPDPVAIDIANEITSSDMEQK